MMSTDPDTFVVEGLTMDQSKYHSVRADILAFPHMSRKDEQLLQTVLNNMSQGVLMFDQETRLIFCNQRYIELYGLSPEVVKSGCNHSNYCIAVMYSGEMKCYQHEVDLPEKWRKRLETN